MYLLCNYDGKLVFLPAFPESVVACVGLSISRTIVNFKVHSLIYSGYKFHKKKTKHSLIYSTIIDHCTV